MKKIVFLLCAFAFSASAQIEKVWELKLPEVKFKSEWSVDETPSKSNIYSPSGACIINLNPFVMESGHTQLWISSKGKLVYAFKDTEDNQPAKTYVLTFNDDYIVSYDNIFRIGYLWVWSVDDGKLKWKKTEVPHGKYFSGDWNNDYNYEIQTNNSTTFYAADNDNGMLVLTKYRLSTKSSTFWVQQSEDLETWKDVVEVPQGDTPKEFFRIKPEN